MAEFEQTFKWVARPLGQMRGETARARAKREARAELRRILDEEARQRELDRQTSLSRTAAPGSDS